MNQNNQTNQIDQMNQTDRLTEQAWLIAVTPLRLCRQSASSGWVQFQLRDGVLKTSPFFRNQGEEFVTQRPSRVHRTTASSMVLH